MSRAGSQVMNMGRMAGEVVDIGGVEAEEDSDEEGEMLADDDDEEEEEALTRSIIVAILSSSSGQMSGQWEKPKYTCRHCENVRWLVVLCRVF